MGSDGVSEVGAGAGGRVGRMVNGTRLASGFITGSRAGGGDRSVGAETSVHNVLVEVGWFFESDKGWFGKEVLGLGILGEDVETFPRDPFETVPRCKPCCLGKCRSVPPIIFTTYRILRTIRRTLIFKEFF